ncbi:MAG: hypothetical protein LC687_02215, partial [Actinobacteria bacterium]|nr:hypothetical protein [Actinomycetota bacterium]
MAELTILEGNVLDVLPPLNKIIIIPHCVNDEQKMGAGIALQIKNRWPHVYQLYHDNPATKILGNLQTVKIDENLYIANMTGQHGVGHDQTGRPPIRYQALEQAMEKLA